MSATISRFSGLHGALLLARGRAEGMRYVADDWRTAARSFWAAAVCLPFFVAVMLIGWSQDGWPSDLPHAVVLELLAFTIGWAGYAVLSHPVVAAFQRSTRWPRFITIWNWCNVVQYGLLLVAAAISLAHPPAWLNETVELVAQGWALWLEWFAIRLALQLRGLQAAVVMAPDVLLGLLLAAILGPN